MGFKLKLTTKVAIIIIVIIVLGISLLYLDSGFEKINIMGFLLIGGMCIWMFVDLSIGRINTFH